MFQEFKEFALKGNMFDMAVGIILGGAFGTVIASLVGDVVMPIIGLFGGGADFSNSFMNLSGSGEYASLVAAKEAGANTLNYGSFITAIISFLILAFVLFMMVKAYNKAKLAMDGPPEEKAPAGPPAQEVLLAEIRDLLAK